jgi:GT2 family glycosyltransferase
MPIAETASSSEALLAVIIVNFRTPDMTIDCLRSIEPEIVENSRIRVCVVENGSGDESGARLAGAIEKEGWRSWCTLHSLDKNLGFSGGNNHGIAAVRAEGGARYILLLNSDTVVQPGCFARCVQIMERGPDIGALSCRLLNADGSVQNVCRRFPTPLRCFIAHSSLPWRFPAWFSWADCEDLGWDRNTTARDVEWLGGAFMMLRGDWVAQHHALDDRFFFYGEDVELCHRVWQTGFRCHYDPTSTVIHLGGGSSDPSRIADGTRSFHMWRGRYLIQAICYGRLAKTFLQCTDLLMITLRIARAKITGDSHSAQDAMRKDVRRILIRNWRTWETWSNHDS